LRTPFTNVCFLKFFAIGLGLLHGGMVAATTINSKHRLAGASTAR
jgi:hypothetical protein